MAEWLDKLSDWVNQPKELSGPLFINYTLYNSREEIQKAYNTADTCYRNMIINRTAAISTYSLQFSLDTLSMSQKLAWVLNALDRWEDVGGDVLSYSVYALDKIENTVKDGLSSVLKKISRTKN